MKITILKWFKNHRKVIIPEGGARNGMKIPDRNPARFILLFSNSHMSISTRRISKLYPSGYPIKISMLQIKQSGLQLFLSSALQFICECFCEKKCKGITTSSETTENSQTQPIRILCFREAIIRFQAIFSLLTLILNHS